MSSSRRRRLVQTWSDDDDDDDEQPIRAQPAILSNRLSPIICPDDDDDSDPKGTRTSFSFKDLERVASSYPWPKGVALCLPSDDDDGVSLAKYPNAVVVHEAGFRVPVPEFVREFLSWTRLCPAQISPNAWRLISAFGILCSQMGKQPTFLQMQYLFQFVVRKGFFALSMPGIDVVSIPSNVGTWKSRWFLVKTEGDGFDFPIHPGEGLRFRKGPEEIKEMPSEVKALRDELSRLKTTDYSELITFENLESAKLSLPHPPKSKSMSPGPRHVKSAVRKRKRVSSSKKKAVMPHSSPRSEEESMPSKRRRVQPSLASVPRDFLASSLTMEDVSALGSLPDERVGSEFARSVALRVYHFNNLIEKHEKLKSSHSDSQAKLKSLQEDNKDLKKELLCARESAKSLKDHLRKTQQEHAENLKKIQQQNAANLKQIQEQNADNLKRIQAQNAENLTKTQEEIADSLKKTLDENDQQHQRIMELEMDLSKAKEEFLDSKDFRHRVAHYGDTYYRTGLRVGVSQAVKKYQHLDSKIVAFEPDFDDGYEVPDHPPYSSPIRFG